MSPGEWLISKGWQFDKVCAKCSGGGIQYSKREYWVKLFEKGGIFKLYHKGLHTNTQPIGKLEDTVKDI